MQPVSAGSRGVRTEGRGAPAQVAALRCAEICTPWLPPAQARIPRWFCRFLAWLCHATETIRSFPMPSLSSPEWCPRAIWRAGHACSGARCTVRGMLRWAWELITRDRQQEMRSARRTLRGMLRLAWELITRDRRAALLAAQAQSQGGNERATARALRDSSRRTYRRVPLTIDNVDLTSGVRRPLNSPASRPVALGMRAVAFRPSTRPDRALRRGAHRFPALPVTLTGEGLVPFSNAACSTFHPVTTSSRGRRI